MSLLQSLAGMTELQITGADIAGSMYTLSRSGIEIVSSAAEDDVTVRMILYRNDCKKAINLLKKRGDTVNLTQKRGVYWLFRQFLGRPVLVIGCLLLFISVLYIPTRVFFVRIEGNTSVPPNQILEAAEQCGIKFGASRREVRSEQMKNRLLHTMPQLQWAGVNTYGCTAVITVKERTEPDVGREVPQIGSIIASCDGVILYCTATNGNLLCRPGQAVRAGEVLISGFTDCGLSIQATLAQGEVFAQTEHQLNVIIPTEYEKCVTEEPRHQNFSLIIGKKRIKLWKDSGICDTTCGRMYKEYYMALPGGFRLPVSVLAETYVDRATVTELRSPEMCEQILSQFAYRNLVQQMIAGSILQKDQLFQETEGIYLLDGTYICTEMIGRVRQEQIGDYNGEND